MIIDGKAVSAAVRERVRTEVDAFRSDTGVTPGLATVLVGADPASALYVANKRKACEEAGMASIHHEPAPDIRAQELRALLTGLNTDPAVHGILLQLPVPDHLDAASMVETIAPVKDVDGLTAINAGRLAQGDPRAMVPCTPQGVMELLRASGPELDGAQAVVVGRSMLVGRPIAALLLAANATVTTCHSRTRGLAEVCRSAEVLVVAAGRPRMIGADAVREGATVIDVGIHRTDDGLVGDVDFDAVEPLAAAITPVPGGVGPMTIAMLLMNTLEAARRQVAEG
ncbi:MAG: bifunctional methylenetetrahydrofolate dehydrogenase/methenyltetrahydrofolate cyclohydrolase FolD [Thermoleophilaceae bacterium]|nr:bifunctional methylenetetrahydrofolate dehydrogenase/methenyltetrahydrofolate cyclohydrolase FolD [Thermoleophilaceae bacterium]